MAAGGTRSAVQFGLVGRERELAQLRGALDDASRGRGRVWLVSGEPGIGKTRLLEAVTEAAEPTEIRVLWGRCWEGGGASAYWPWTQILRAAMEGVSPEALVSRLGSGAADVASLVPELAARLPGLAPAPLVDAPGVRLRVFESVTRLLVATAMESPLLVVLDDLHAADEASLLLLEYVAVEAPRAQLTVVGTYRDAEVTASPRLTQLLSAVARHGHRLRLGGLSRDEVEALFAAVTAAPPAPELVARVHDATDGNPFLIMEVARLLSSRRGAPRPGDHLPLPDEAYAIVARRLDPLPSSLRSVLTAAAVLGRDFDLASLAALLGDPAADVLDALGEARRQGVVEEAGAGRWSFAHALLREVLVDELAPSGRAALHGRAATALAARAGSAGGVHLAAIAHHRYEAAVSGEEGGATDSCAAAGEEAMSTLAFEDAAGWYERALEVLALCPQVDERRHYELLTALGHARFLAGQFPDARRAYGDALDKARSLQSSELLAEAALGFFLLGHSGDSLTPLEEALAGLPRTDGPLKARLLLALGGGIVVVRPEQWRDGAAMCNAGLAMVRRVGDPGTLLHALHQWHRFQWDWDPLGVEERLAVADEALLVGDDAGRAGEWARPGIRLWRFCDLLDLGRVAEARAEADSATREAQRLRMPLFTSLASTMQTGLALLRGDVGVAQELQKVAPVDVYGTKQENEYWVAWFTSAVHRLTGAHREARAALEEVRVPYSGIFGPFWQLGFRADRALSAAHLGEETARQDLESVVAEALSLPGPPRRPDVLVRLAEACWLLGATEFAGSIYELLRPYEGRLVTLELMAVPFGAVDRYLGQLASLLARYEAAEVHFDAAHDLHRRWGAHPFLAHGQADHARMALLRDGPGDRRRAAELAAEAAAGYRVLGMAHYEERVRKLRPRSASPSPAPTLPERGVLRDEGEYWCVAYQGQEVRIRDSKGLRYLARLLRAPGRELHVLDLTGGGAAPDRGEMRGDAGALLDPAAKAAYRRRLAELEAEADEADAMADLGRAERVRVERDFLIAELAAAVGLGGRDRVAASAAERARMSVTKGVRSAIARLAQAHPVLGTHLQATVRTGTYCIYQPDPRLPISWGEP